MPLDFIAQRLLFLQHAPRRCADGAMVQVGVLRIEEPVIEHRATEGHLGRDCTGADDRSVGPVTYWPRLLSRAVALERKPEIALYSEFPPPTGTSFNGRTPRSGRGYWGSNPYVPATQFHPVFSRAGRAPSLPRKKVSTTSHHCRPSARQRRHGRSVQGACRSSFCGIRSRLIQRLLPSANIGDPTLGRHLSGGA